MNVVKNLVAAAVLMTALASGTAFAKDGAPSVPACCAKGSCCAAGACCTMPGCCKADKSCCDPVKGVCTSACGCLTNHCCGGSSKAATAKRSQSVATPRTPAGKAVQAKKTAGAKSASAACCVKK